MYTVMDVATVTAGNRLVAEDLPNKNAEVLHYNYEHIFLLSPLIFIYF